MLVLASQQAADPKIILFAIFLSLEINLLAELTSWSQNDSTRPIPLSSLLSIRNMDYHGQDVG